MSAPGYFPFFPTDFIDGVRGMPLEEVGAYILLLCGMYQKGGRIPDELRYITALTGMPPQKWPFIRRKLMERGKLSEPEPGQLSNGRVIKEMMRQAARIEARRDAQSAGGKKSAAKRAAARAANPAQEPTPGTIPGNPGGVVPDKSLETPDAAQVDSRLKTQEITVGSPVSTKEVIRETVIPTHTPPPRPSRAGAARVRVDGNNPPGFDAWWALYPRKDDKGHARAAYAAALRKGATVEQLLDGLRAYQFDVRPKFRPLPATWLNGERWLAEADSEPELDPVLAALGLTAERALAAMAPSTPAPDTPPPSQPPVLAVQGRAP